MESLFIVVTGITFGFLLAATPRKKAVSIFSAIWLSIIAVAALLGFFQKTDTVPPRMPLLLFPLIAFMIVLFTTKKGRSFIDSLSAKVLTWMSIVRVPVELILWGLFLEGMVPEVMTFEGRNWDILAGLTAPVVAFLYFHKKKLSKKVFLVWNVISLVLLLNIIVHAILSVPSPIQQFGFEQPNKAILEFPYVWLASFVAPAVLFSHLVMIRRLILVRNSSIH
jgi:hypothetical protein